MDLDHKLNCQAERQPWWMPSRSVYWLISHQLQSLPLGAEPGSQHISLDRQQLLSHTSTQIPVQEEEGRGTLPGLQAGSSPPWTPQDGAGDHVLLYLGPNQDITQKWGACQEGSLTLVPAEHAECVDSSSPDAHQNHWCRLGVRTCGVQEALAFYPRS